VIRLKPFFPQHAWSDDFMQASTHSGVLFRILNVIDEYSRECLASNVARKLSHHDVLDVLTKLFVQKGVPVHIRCDNGAEFTVKNVRSWLANLQIKPLFIEPGSPWEHGYIESFNGKMRDELLHGEIFYTLKEVEILIEMWRKEYNTARPHSAPGYRPPVPASIMGPSTQLQPVGLT
jgi:putative transposase